MSTTHYGIVYNHTKSFPGQIFLDNLQSGKKIQKSGNLFSTVQCKQVPLFPDNLRQEIFSPPDRWSTEEMILNGMNSKMMYP